MSAFNLRTPSHLDRGQICRRYGQKHDRRGVNTIIVQMFDGKGVVAWTHGNPGGRLLKQGGGGGYMG